MTPSSCQDIMRTTPQAVEDVWLQKCTKGPGDFLFNEISWLLQIPDLKPYLSSLFKRNIRITLFITQTRTLLREQGFLSISPVYLISCSFVSNSLQPHGLQPARLLCPLNSLGKNTGMHSHSPFQGIFLIYGSKLGLLHCRQILYCLSHPGSLCVCSILYLKE